MHNILLTRRRTNTQPYTLTCYTPAKSESFTVLYKWYRFCVWKRESSSVKMSLRGGGSFYWYRLQVVHTGGARNLEFRSTFVYSWCTDLLIFFRFHFRDWGTKSSARIIIIFILFYSFFSFLIFVLVHRVLLFRFSFSPSLSF